MEASSQGVVEEGCTASVDNATDDVEKSTTENQQLVEPVKEVIK